MSQAVRDARVVAVASPESARDTFFWPSIAIVAFVFPGSLLADQMGNGAAALAVIWAPPPLSLSLPAPPYVSARVLLVLALVLESPDEQPGCGYWTPPFTPASFIFYAGMKKWSGLSALSFSLFSLLCLLLFLRARKVRQPGSVPPPPEALKTIYVYCATLAAMEIYGIWHGGQGQPSYWQMIQPVTLALCALAFLHSVRGPQDFRALGTIVVVSAVTKGLLVAWVYHVVCRPMNIKPFYATTHSDSITFGTAILVLATNLFEHRDKKSFKRFALLVPFIAISIVMNNRRLAFVGAGAGVFTTFAVLKPSAFKKKLTKAVLIAAPFFVAYVKIGGNSTNPLFAPAALINSVLSGTDSSAITRDIENYNLIVTLKENRFWARALGGVHRRGEGGRHLRGLLHVQVHRAQQRALVVEHRRARLSRSSGWSTR